MSTGERNQTAFAMVGTIATRVNNSEFTKSLSWGKTKEPRQAIASINEATEAMSSAQVRSELA